MISCVTMTDLDADLDKRFDDIDVESILARCANNKSISRKRSLLRAPEFIQRLPAEETVEEGSSVTFGCKLVGLPKPTVTWFKDDDVIGPDARAKPECDNTGLHSLQIGEVSRCDVGTYKVRASNSEGSSANSLYLSVKAKSKSRNRKKKSRAVACAPMFPAIVELDAEEQRESLEVERQPESPLTPLYTNISRKSPVTWPEYLGDWAYSLDVNKHDPMDLEIECEDVFDSDSDISPSAPCPTLTFVSSAYAQINNDNPGETPVVNSINSNVEQNHGNGVINDVSAKAESDNDSNEGFNNKFEENGGDNGDDSHNSASYTDVMNNNEKNKRLSEQSPISNGNANDVTRKSRADIARRSQGTLHVPSKEVEDKTVICDPVTISKISVNRSYATGNSTLSVARRSPSPYPHSRKHMTQNELSRYSNINDTSTLQNLSNERILQRMKQSGKSLLSWNYFLLSFYRKCDVDHLMELFLMLCGGTFIALFLDLSPSTFILDILIALFIRLVLKFILDET